MAAASGIASAAGGWVVPSDQLAMVHQNEMISAGEYEPKPAKHDLRQ